MSFRPHMEEQLEHAVVETLIRLELEGLGVAEVDREYSLDENEDLVISIYAVKPVERVTVTFSVQPEISTFGSSCPEIPPASLS